MQLGLKSGGGGMLCAYALQCGSVQCINDNGFVCALCVLFSYAALCEASWSFLSASSVCVCFVSTF